MKITNNGVPSAILGVLFAIGGIVLLIALLFINTSHGMPVWLVLLIAGITTLLGSAVAFTAKNTRILIVKDGESIAESKKVLGGTLQRQTFMSQNVAAVQLETVNEYDSTADSSGHRGTNTKRRSNLFLILKDNSRIPLGSKSKNSNFTVGGFDVGSMIQKAPLSKEANMIAEFLGVPVQTAGEVPLGEAVQKVRDAIISPGNDRNTGQPTVQPVATATTCTSAKPWSATGTTPALKYNS